MSLNTLALLLKRLILHLGIYSALVTLIQRPNLLGNQAQVILQSHNIFSFLHYIIKMTTNSPAREERNPAAASMNAMR